MADNQSGKKKAGRKKKMKDGVVLKVSDIERECDRLKRRPRAALYPLLPITEPLKLNQKKSINLHKGRRRHRKHCRKRLGLKRPPFIIGHTSRSKLVQSESTTCSRTLQHNNQARSSFPKRPHWGSIADMFSSTELRSCPPDPPPIRHHHYHVGHKPAKQHSNKTPHICHHDPLVVGHRTSVATSLLDLRELAARRHLHRRRYLDPESGGDAVSTGSNTRSRKIVSVIVASVASFILMMCVALVAVTLRLTPAIDELGECTSLSCRNFDQPNLNNINQHCIS
ncbi:hypothetical protein JTE90_003792 [Oedothorax gibbosus]|uniref:Uncharacterized protein n=1 Tax=Oedothorax gibbosus TaxID=931172 RepID=A0AAV6VBA2_9ARAC|nr:hypothetical protein JTE90_003792 [Oedothorax gibbosus]